MSKKAIATILILALLLMIISQILVNNSAFAQMGPAMNPGPDYTPLSITVLNPLKNHVYSPDFELKLKITKPASWFTSGAAVWNYGCQGEVTFLHYSIDGQPRLTIPANDTGKGISEKPIPTTVTFKIPLEGLNAGWHSIIVSVDGRYYYWSSGAHPEYTHNLVGGSSEKILFYVDDEQHVWGGFISPLQNAAPPKISILSPNSTVFVSNDVFLSFKVGTTKDTAVLTDVGYRVSLQGNASFEHHIDETPSTTYYAETLASLSDGNYTVTVFAAGVGSFVSENTIYVYDIGSSSSVNFTVDSILPTISFTTTQNKTHDTAKVVLDFSVNKPVSQIIYSLDNRGNLTTNSNVSLTLDNLSNGEHNVTIYAKDEYGIISAPTTVYFSVKVFPTVTVLAVSFVAVIVLVAAGLLVYHKKHKHNLVPTDSSSIAKIGRIINIHKLEFA